MTAYIANHQKKKRILADKEANLIWLIKHNADVNQLLFAAEAVKEARIRVLNLEKSRIVPTRMDPFRKIDEKIKTISKIPLIEIIKEFGGAKDESSNT